MENNTLLQYFGVNNHAELIAFIKDNPDDERVKQVKELLIEIDMDIDMVIENE